MLFFTIIIENNSVEIFLGTFGGFTSLIKVNSSSASNSRTLHDYVSTEFSRNHCSILAHVQCRQDASSERY